jgi:hypothetical protein
MKGISRQVEKITPLPEWCIGRGAGVWRCGEPPHDVERRPPPLIRGWGFILYKVKALSDSLEAFEMPENSFLAIFPKL